MTNDSAKMNWERVDSLTDDQIDTSEMPPLTEDFFARAKWRKPTLLILSSALKDYAIRPEPKA